MFFRLTIIVLIFAVYINSLSNDKVFRPTQKEFLNPNKTPIRSVYGIKSIQPDFWNTDDIAGNGAGGVSMNYVWAFYQPSLKKAPCDRNEEEYEGSIFFEGLIF